MCADRSSKKINELMYKIKIKHFIAQMDGFRITNGHLMPWVKCRTCLIIHCSSPCISLTTLWKNKMLLITRVVIFSRRSEQHNILDTFIFIFTYFIYNLILFFSKGILNWSKKIYKMLQMISIPNKCCSFKLSSHQTILKTVLTVKSPF